MAQVEDVDPDLRALARRVPDVTRATLTPMELQVRCAYVARLLAEAEETGDRKADQLRARSGRVLKAMSPASYQENLARLAAEGRQARLSGDQGRERAVQGQIRLLDAEHPQVPPQEVAQAVAAELTVMAEQGRLRQLKIPPAPANGTFSRRFGRIRTPRGTSKKKGRKNT